MTLLKTTLALSLFAAAALAQEKGEAQPTPEERRKQFIESVSRGVVYRVQGMDKVELRNDVSYKKVGDQTLSADVYIPRPRKQAARFPAVLLIHGGVGDDLPLKPKEWGTYRSWGELLSASGFVAVTFNQRLGFPEPRYDEAASDVADMIALVRENAEYFHIDEKRICLAAFSAGGPLLSTAMRDRPPYIKCLVSYYNFMDLQEYPRLQAMLPAEKLKQYSPITYLDRDPEKLPPIFVARAGKDAIPHLLPSLDRFVQKAMEVNAPVTMMNHPTGPHGFDTRTPDSRSREILKATIDFLKWHLK